MDLEKLNANYEKVKKRLEAKKSKIEKLEKDIQTAMEDIQIAKGAKIVAQRKGDAEDVKRAEEAIKNEKEKIKKIKNIIEQEKEDILMFQDRLDKIIEEIKQNPEMKKHLEQVLAKRYEREIKKINLNKKQEEKNKEEATKKIESLEVVRTMIKEHPAMKNHMQGMLNANYKIEKLNEKLSKLDPAKDKKEIEKIKKELTSENARLSKNRDEILTYASKNKLKITKETLEEIMKNSVYNKKTNSVNIEASIDQVQSKAEKEIKVYDKRILGYNKQISNNEKAIVKLGYSIPERGEEAKDAPTTTRKPKSKEIESEDESKPSTENKPKWWQFIKRFNNWNENRKVKALPVPVSEEKNLKEQKGEFAASLKYKVVKDIAKEMQQETLREVKREGKPVKENEEENIL